MGKIIFPIIFPHSRPAAYNYFPHFLVIFFPIRRSEAIRFDIRIGRLIGGAREGLKIGGPGAQKRGCCRMGKIRMGKMNGENNGENNGEKQSIRLILQ